MIGLIKAIGLVKAAAAITALTAATAFTATVALPAAATLGQAHATAGTAAAGAQGPANGTSTGPSTDTSTGKDVAAIQARLAANQARIVTVLDDVLANLRANGADQHAIDAVTSVVDRIQNGDTGLNRASSAVGGQGGQGVSGNAAIQSAPPSPLPSPVGPAQGHPTSTSHPGKP